MAMHRSEELAEAASVLFQQILSLDLKPVACAFIIIDEANKTGEVFITADGNVIPQSFKLPYHGEPAQDKIYESWEKGDPHIMVDLEGDELLTHLNFIAQNMPVGELLEASGETHLDRLVPHIIHFQHGFLGISYLEPNKKAIPILKRFARVFEQTYTRFLDLQKAEAQAREAQIEAALERVRARTMAMHKSNEIADAAAEIYTQLSGLGIRPYVCAFIIIDEKTEVGDLWMTDFDGRVLPHFGQIRSFKGDPYFENILKNWKKGGAILPIHPGRKSTPTT